MQYEQASTWAICKHLYKKYEQALVESGIGVCLAVITLGFFFK